MKKRYGKAALSLLLLAALLTSLFGCAAQKAQTEAEEEPERTLLSADLMADVTPAQNGAPAEITPDAADAAADFAVRLFRAASEDGENTLVSPLSVLCALAMTANGAEGATLFQMESTLGLRRELYNELFRSWLAVLKESGSPLKLANAIWFKDAGSFTVNRDFLQTNADCYGADAYRAPFDDTTLREINDWVDQNTDGMIPEILDRIPEEAVMYLVNALAFDAKWQSPFPDYCVSEGSFTAEDGTVRTVEYMHAEQHSYLDDGQATGFLKYYEGGRYAFAALLPDEGLSVDAYLASLDGAALRALLTSPQSETVYISLPKFETRWTGELSSALKTMGMELPFDTMQADFSGLGTSTEGNLAISRVLHKTYLSVSEEGTRAGAATTVEMACGAAPRDIEPKYVYLERPFVYLLIDCETGIPLFIGTMRDTAA